jgi:hypothetical protein
MSLTADWRMEEKGSEHEDQSQLFNLKKRFTNRLKKKSQRNECKYNWNHGGERMGPRTF